MSAPGPAGARRIRRALLANGAPPNCKLLGVGPLAADFEDAEHRIADFQIVDARAQCGDRSEKSRPSTNGKVACEYWSARTGQSAPLTLAADDSPDENGRRPMRSVPSRIVFRMNIQSGRFGFKFDSKFTSRILMVWLRARAWLSRGSALVANTLMHDGDPTSPLPWDAVGCMTYRAESKKARNVKTSNTPGDRTAGERGIGAQSHHH